VNVDAVELLAVLEDGTPRAANLPVDLRRPLTFYAGTLKRLRVTLSTPTGVPFDFAGEAGAVLVFSVKARAHDARAIFTAESAAAVPTTPRGRMDLDVTLPARKFPAGAYVWDLWVVTTAQPLGRCIIPVSPLRVRASAR
jgi:hypothetical protein